MLLRRTPEGVLAIGQASHAWISGQLARAWGNPRFGPVEPYDEVCLAAEQHDVGMARWDLEPTLNPDTRLPHSFIEMPLGTHLTLWSAAALRLLTQSRYASLLVAMHGRRLYQMRDLAKLSADDADAVRRFIDEQYAFEHRVLAWLRIDPASAASASEAIVARNSQLIWTWDYLSLAVCLDWPPCLAHRVPTGDGPAELELSPGPEPGSVIVDPWPFSASRVRLHCDARLLEGGYENEHQLAEALARAPWQTVSFELRSAGQLQ